jgi:multidrug efflux pump subunit AcrA (membrane-fusion protein)
VIYDQERKTFAELFDVAAEGQRRRVPIQIGISNGTITEVVSGLAEGETVVRPSTGGILD